MTDPHDRKQLWFDRGFWWYSCPHKNATIEISSLMRRESYNVMALARSLGLARRSFERVVSDSLGISPGVWLRHERAVAARYLILEGNSVKEVAAELGFRHQGDFSNDFKRWHGVNPTDFHKDAKRRALQSSVELQGDATAQRYLAGMLAINQLAVRKIGKDGVEGAKKDLEKLSVEFADTPWGAVCGQLQEEAERSR